MKNMLVRKIMAAAVVASVGVMALTGCGIDVNVSSETTHTEETTDAPEMEEVAAEETEVVSPFVKDLEMYDEVISKLSKDQWYTFADISKDYDILLVTDGTYDNLDGNMAAIDATLYGLDSEGKVVELGTVESNGTAYPLAVYDQCLMFGGNHHMGMIFVENGNVITKLDASETFDEEGNATYSLFDYDEHYEGPVDDDTKLKEMYEIYGEAIVLNFNQVQ